LTVLQRDTILDVLTGGVMDDAFVAAGTATRATDFASLTERVAFRPGGEAVLKGMTIEVHRIAALLDGGLSAEQIREDYPSLDAASTAAARAHADAYTRRGCLYPATTAERALNGIGLEALDEVLDAAAP
jgi:uncharacterized protein (DUF433 family)